MKQKSVGIRDVARLAGVSRSTVSLVLNNSPTPTEETRRLVLRAVNKLNYQPDSMFRAAMQHRRAGSSGARQATQVIGFFTSPGIFEIAQRDDGYYSHVANGIHEATSQHHYHLMWEKARTGENALCDMVAENRVDGLLIEGDFPPLVHDLLIKRVPVTFIDRSYPRLNASSVMPNIELAVREQLDYLWGLGHRNIVLFQHAEPSVHGQRYQNAFTRFFREKQRKITQPSLCKPRDINLDTHEQVMAQYARQLATSKQRPTALMAVDVYACSIMTELQKLELRVPKDISVIGMNDTLTARIATPQLTSYRFPMDELGRSATELLIQQIQNPSRPVRHLLVNGKIVERASCGAVPKQS